MNEWMHLNAYYRHHLKICNLFIFGWFLVILRAINTFTQHISISDLTNFSLHNYPIQSDQLHLEYASIWALLHVFRDKSIFRSHCLAILTFVKSSRFDREKSIGIEFIFHFSVFFFLFYSFWFCRFFFHPSNLNMNLVYGGPVFTDCERPPTIHHGKAELSVDDDGIVVTALYSCDAGYQLNGQAQITCNTDTDEWQGDLPVCKLGNQLIELRIAIS